MFFDGRIKKRKKVNYGGQKTKGIDWKTKIKQKQKKKAENERLIPFIIQIQCFFRKIKAVIKLRTLAQQKLSQKLIKLNLNDINLYLISFEPSKISLDRLNIFLTLIYETNIKELLKIKQKYISCLISLCLVYHDNDLQLLQNFHQLISNSINLTSIHLYGCTLSESLCKQRITLTPSMSLILSKISKFYNFNTDSSFIIWLKYGLINLDQFKVIHSSINTDFESLLIKNQSSAFFFNKVFVTLIKYLKLNLNTTQIWKLLNVALLKNDAKQNNVTQISVTLTNMKFNGKVISVENVFQRKGIFLRGKKAISRQVDTVSIELEVNYEELNELMKDVILRRGILSGIIEKNVSKDINLVFEVINTLEIIRQKYIKDKRTNLLLSFINNYQIIINLWSSNAFFAQILNTELSIPLKTTKSEYEYRDSGDKSRVTEGDMRERDRKCKVMNYLCFLSGILLKTDTNDRLFQDMKVIKNIIFKLRQFLCENFEVLILKQDGSLTNSYSDPDKCQGEDILDFYNILHERYSTSFKDIFSFSSKQLHGLLSQFDNRSSGSLEDIEVDAEGREEDEIELEELNLSQPFIYHRILLYVPQLLNFEIRSKIFFEYLDKTFNTDNRHYLIGQQNEIVIRRLHLYQDAYEQLEGRVREDFKIRFENEPGIDGGGLFKELMTLLIQDIFLSEYSDQQNNVTLGSGYLWKSTDKEELYPSPEDIALTSLSLRKYHFAGEILAKCISRGIVLAPRFAPFFFNLLTNKVNKFSNMIGYDRQIYKNLNYLKTLSANEIKTLNLFFEYTTVAQSNKQDILKTRNILLKKDGNKIEVNAENKFEYITRVSHYLLNKQFTEQVKSFIDGFITIIPKIWLKIFSTEELYLIFSGSDQGYKVDELKRCTTYSRGYFEDDLYIKWFWEVLEEFNEEKKCKFLSFVTSCPRPPLKGFKSLRPKFCIQEVDEVENLPTASTCVNLLKLPRYKSKATLKEKLTYSIEHHTGFQKS